MRVGNHEIQNDGMQWSVARYNTSEDKDGKEREVLSNRVSYFTSFENVAKKVNDDRIKAVWDKFSDIDSLVAYLDKVLK